MLTHCDAVLSNIKDSLSFEYFMEIHNAVFSGLTELFPAGAVEKPVKFSWVLHDEAIRKAVTIKKKQPKPSKKIQFPQSAHTRQPFEHPES